jgi:hypothetical protein
MLTRRETILGGALTLMWGGCACAQGGPERPHGFGCVLEPAQAEAFLATATEPQPTDGPETAKLVASSGDRALDYALAQTLSRLTDMFGVLPGFSFFDDYDDANAYWTSLTRLKRADGTVLFGTRYLQKYMREPESPEVVITAICAHEFGHAVQYKRNFMQQLNAGQPTVKRTELNADFFAGYFAGARKLQKPDYPAAVFAANRFSRGDFSKDKDHHGTPEERAAAVVRGFETAYRERHSFAEAIQIGINYVSRL